MIDQKWPAAWRLLALYNGSSSDQVTSHAQLNITLDLPTNFFDFTVLRNLSNLIKTLSEDQNAEAITIKNNQKQTVTKIEFSINPTHVYVFESNFQNPDTLKALQNLNVLSLKYNDVYQNIVDINYKVFCASYQRTQLAIQEQVMRKSLRSAWQDGNTGLIRKQSHGDIRSNPFFSGEDLGDCAPYSHDYLKIVV